MSDKTDPHNPDYNPYIIPAVSIINTDTSNWVLTNTSNGTFTITPAKDPEPLICNVCKEEIDEDECWENYGRHIPRHICEKCHTKTMDRIYGITDVNVDTEELLYGK